MVSPALTEEPRKLVAIVLKILHFLDIDVQSKINAGIGLKLDLAVVKLACLPANSLCQVLLSAIDQNGPTLVAAIRVWARQLSDWRVLDVLRAVLVVCHAGLQLP